MSIFTVPISVGHPNGGDLYPVDVVVGTGVAHTVLPESLLARMKLTPREKRQFMIADGSTLEYGYGLARFRIEGVEWPCPVVFGPEDNFLLGESTLAMFNLKVDHIEQHLCQAEVQWLGWRFITPDPDAPRGAAAILQMFNEIHQSMPEDAFETLPTDLSVNFKHYLYGWPKEIE